MDFSALNPNTSNSLNLAARVNDVESLKRLLQSGRNPNCNDNRGWTAIHEAAANNSMECVNLLLSHADTLPLAQTFEGDTALFLACKNKQCSMKTLNLLIKHAGNLSKHTSYEQVSVLHAASGINRVELVEALIRAGANLDAQDFDGDTPLHEAVRNKDAHTSSVLLHAGAESSIRNSVGLTPFLLACFKGYMDCINEIFPFTIDINESANDGNTGLILAAHRGALDIINFLLANGADPNIVNNRGQSPLHIALANGYAKVFQKLLPVTDDVVIGKNIMLMACEPLYFSTEILKTLLESDLASEFFNECDEFRNPVEKIFDRKLKYTEITPLCSILKVIDYIYRSSPELSELLLMLLLTKGVTVNSMYKQECPPLVYLHYSDHFHCYTQVIKILVEHDCNVDYTTVASKDGLQIPDAILASISSNCHTLPLLLTYSLQVDPENILKELVENNMIEQKILPEIIIKILPFCYFSASFLEKLKNQLNPNLNHSGTENYMKLIDLLIPRVPTMKHLCRKIIRKQLRKNISTTQTFFRALYTLPIPKNFHRYLKFETNYL